MHVRGATLVGVAVGGSHSARTGSSWRTDTPLQITAETPATSTWRGSLTRPLGSQLPDPFGAHPALGFHRPQLALPCAPARTRSDRGRSRSSTAADSNNDGDVLSSTWKRLRLQSDVCSYVSADWRWIEKLRGLKGVGVRRRGPAARSARNSFRRAGRARERAPRVTNHYRDRTRSATPCTRQ